MVRRRRRKGPIILFFPLRTSLPTGPLGPNGRWGYFFHFVPYQGGGLGPSPQLLTATHRLPQQALKSRPPLSILILVFLDKSMCHNRPISFAACQGSDLLTSKSLNEDSSQHPRYLKSFTLFMTPSKILSSGRSDCSNFGFLLDLFVFLKISWNSFGGFPRLFLNTS